jgi:uncharacterized protein
MTKRLFVAHGWADDPDQGWIAWLVKQAAARGIEAVAVKFPEPQKPSITQWTQLLREAVGVPDEQTVLVGHSLGCYLVLNYLSQEKGQVGGIVLVAGGLPKHRPELLAGLDMAAVKAKAMRRICIYSDDDRVVPLEASVELAEAIEAERVLDAGKRHFAGLRGVIELPSVLAAVLSCYGLK